MFSLDNVQAASSFQEPMAERNESARILNEKLKKSTNMLKLYNDGGGGRYYTSDNCLLSSYFFDIKDSLSFFKTPAEPNAALIFSLKSIKIGYADIAKKLGGSIRDMEDYIEICQKVLSYSDDQIILMLGMDGIYNVHRGVMEYMKDVKEIKWEDEVNSLRSGAKEFIEGIKEIEVAYASGLEKLRSITRYLRTRNRVEGEGVDSDLPNSEEREGPSRQEIVEVLARYVGGLEILEVKLKYYCGSCEGGAGLNILKRESGDVPNPLELRKVLDILDNNIWLIARSLPTSKQVKGEKIDSGLPNQRGASRQLREEIVEALDDVGGNIWWRLKTFGSFMEGTFTDQIFLDSMMRQCKYLIEKWRLMKEKSAFMKIEYAPSLMEAVDLAACLIDMLEMERIDNDPSYDDFEAEKFEVALSQLNSRRHYMM